MHPRANFSRCAVALLLALLQNSNAGNSGHERFQQWSAAKRRKELASAPKPVIPKLKACPAVIDITEGSMQAHLETNRRLMVFFINPQQSSSVEMQSSYCALAEQADDFAVAEVDVAGARQWSAELGAGFDRTWLDFTPIAAWIEVGQKPVRVRLSGGHFSTQKVPVPHAQQLLRWIRLTRYPAVQTFASFAELEHISSTFGTVLVGLFDKNNSVSNRTFGALAQDYAENVLLRDIATFALPRDLAKGRELLGVGNVGTCIGLPKIGQPCEALVSANEVISLNFHRSRRMRFVAHALDNVVADSEQLTHFALLAASPEIRDFRFLAKPEYNFPVRPADKVGQLDGPYEVMYVTDEDFQEIRSGQKVDARLASSAMKHRSTLGPIYVVPAKEALWRWGAMENLPCVVIRNMTFPHPARFHKRCGLASSPQIENMLDTFASGELDRFVLQEKTLPAPLSGHEYMQQVVHSTFAEVVLNNTADVLLLLHGDDGKPKSEKQRAEAKHDLQWLLNGLKGLHDQLSSGDLAPELTKDNVVFAQLNLLRNEINEHPIWPPSNFALPCVVIVPARDKMWRNPPEWTQPWVAYTSHSSNNPLYYLQMLQERGTFFPRTHKTWAAEVSAHAKQRQEEMANTETTPAPAPRQEEAMEKDEGNVAHAPTTSHMDSIVLDQRDSAPGGNAADSVDYDELR